jgi:hypothetical protein
MQQVRMNVDISGTWNGEPWPQHGELVEVDDATAEKMLGNGQASKPGKGGKVEAAVRSADDVETATVDTEPSRRSATKK